jgi:hypothetical protein
VLQPCVQISLGEQREQLLNSSSLGCVSQIQELVIAFDISVAFNKPQKISCMEVKGKTKRTPWTRAEYYINIEVLD